MSSSHALPSMSGQWPKVLGGAVLAAVLGVGSAVVITAVNSSRIDRAEAEVAELDARQRELTEDVVGLRVDVGYSRRALDRLLWAQGIELPPDDGGESIVQSPDPSGP